MHHQLSKQTMFAVLTLVFLAHVHQIRVLCKMEAYPKLLLISLDGFRWDYLSKNGSFPNFKHIVKNGVTARRGLKNVFLTKTFPNHYSILTGLYAESHGVVGNKFYDPVLKEKFDTTKNRSQLFDSRWFDVGAEPIWATNQKAGGSRRSGSVMFYGSDARVKGFIPYKHIPIVDSVPFRNRTETIIKWFTDCYPINLGLLYGDGPDDIGHIFGPDSKEILQKLEEIDKDIGYLLKRLKEFNLLDKMNIIITSDHGMTALIDDAEHTVDLNKYISIDSYDIDATRPVATIRPKSKDLEAEILKNLSSVPHLHVYKKQNMPVDYHYRNNRRIDAITAEPDEHYWIMYNNTPGNRGEHGYNNSMQSMHPFFIAIGPSFKSGYSVETFNTVDLYPLMCLLLGLPAAPNNGSLTIVKDLLKTETVIKSTGNRIHIWVSMVILAVFVAICAAFHVQKSSRGKAITGRLHFYKTDTRNSDKSIDKLPLLEGISDEELEIF